MEAVDVLPRVDGISDPKLIHPWWEGALDENAVNGFVIVEIRDDA
jgi:hypothetical protein